MNKVTCENRRPAVLHLRIAYLCKSTGHVPYGNVSGALSAGLQARQRSGLPVPLYNPPVPPWHRRPWRSPRYWRRQRNCQPCRTSGRQRPVVEDIDHDVLQLGIHFLKRPLQAFAVLDSSPAPRSQRHRHWMPCRGQTEPPSPAGRRLRPAWWAYLHPPQRL